MKYFFLTLAALISFSDFAHAQKFSTTPAIPQTQTTFNNCSNSEQRTALDNLCPSVEGSTLPGCCPPAVKQPALQCQYVVMVSRGQPNLVNSSYRSCQEGTTVSVPCCKTSAINCFKNPVTLPFTQRLIGRNNSCCFEPCPSAAYWRSQPNPRSSISAQHEFFNGGSATQCTTAVLDQCDNGNAESCQEDSPCPVQPGPVNPGPVDPGPVNPGPVNPGPVNPGPVNPGPGTNPPAPRPPVRPGAQ